jgi:hypothetical protein
MKTQKIRVEDPVPDLGKTLLKGLEQLGVLSRLITPEATGESFRNSQGLTVRIGRDTLGRYR